jgi:Flp pilus assembly protein CpaB
MEYAQKLFSTRGGTLVLAGIAAVIATVAVFVYVTNYRDSVKKGGLPATVLVAKSLIPKGTPGETVARKQLFQVQSVRQSQLQEGAIADPSSLRGRVAATDIFPGQQLTASDFTTANVTLASELTGVKRAITIPLDAAHGVDKLKDGDRVDVYAGFQVQPVDSAGRPLASGQARPVLRLIMQDIPVIDVASANARLGASGTRSVTLETTAGQAAKLAFAADNGQIWLTLRPPTGAAPSPPDIVSVETLLLGVPPVTVLKSLGGR